jgi:hypothetical protein
MPVLDTVAELNDRLAGYDVADDARRIGHRTNTVGIDFAFEREALRLTPSGHHDRPGQFSLARDRSTARSG